MSFKSDEDLPDDLSIKPRELVFLLAIAGRIDAQSRLLAQKLDNERYIYYSYAVLDSLSSTYSMLRYFIEVAISSDPHVIYDILTSPGGIAAVVSEALFLVTFSFLASYFDGEKKDPTKMFIATAWPYFRDAMKGLKNAYKGWRSAIQILTMLSGADLKHIIIPIGLILGVFAAANRFWLLYMREKRKGMMKANATLLLEISQLHSLTKEAHVRYLDQIQEQALDERAHAFLAVAAGGLIDGLYLYMGVATLAILSAPAFTAMAIISIFYTLSCVVSRVYEEYDYQLRLMATQTRCRLALTTKELETTYASLLALQADLNPDEEKLEQIKELKKDIRTLIGDFEFLRSQLKKQTQHTYLTATLLGIKHGLFAYGVLASGLFMITSIFLIAPAAFPPALLIACIALGLVLMTGVTAYVVYSQHEFLSSEQNNKEPEGLHQLLEIKENIDRDDVTLLSPQVFNETLEDSASVNPSPQYFFQEWLEVLRSFFSGLSKGNNFATFLSIPFQDADPQAHDHDYPVKLMLIVASAGLFSVVLALRALARGFGRPPVDQPNSVQSLADPEPQGSGESCESLDEQQSTPPPSRTLSAFNLIRFFATRPNSKSNSPDAKTSPNSEDDRVLGLN